VGLVGEFVIVFAGNLILGFFNYNLETVRGVFADTVVAVVV